ncbi:hypothetical protein GCM10007148_21080 [Parvularcula lutaonensis]|nr:hypothetical protein GCM10007148_21080 [Parvularcula lutaonensis]
MIGSSCCFLPVLLVNLGLSSAVVGHLALFARYQEWFLGAGVIFGVSALAFAAASKQPLRPWLVAAVFVIALLLATSLILPNYEGQLLRWASGR